MKPLTQGLIRSFMVVLSISLWVVPGFGQAIDAVTQDRVSQLPKGKPLVVKLKTGKTVKGKLLSAGDNSFVFEPGKANLFDPRPAPVSFTYLDVQSIKLGCGSKWRAILAIGVPVGLMAAAGAAINSQSHSPTGGEAAGVTFALGGGGAVAGYFWGKSLDCRSH